jgi:DNA-directed RNA polymerase subunit alpha
MLNLKLKTSFVTQKQFGLKFNNGLSNNKKIVRKNANIPLSTNQTLFVSCRESRIENSRSLYGCFYLGPFSAEQSLTVANAIRRTLLSELKGCAITSVEIEGATHEYSTLPGIKDSVLDILLNFKEIVLKSQFNFKKPQFIYLKVIGPGVVRAKDLKLPAFIQCVDPNQYIATLADNGILNLKLQIEEGKNYLIQKPLNFQKSLNAISKELLIKKLVHLKKQLHQNKLTKLELKDAKFSSLLIKQNNRFNKNTQKLLIDAIFMPIQKVNYMIEVDHENTNYRSLLFKETEQVLSKNLTLKDKTVDSLNYKIILELWTNGSIHPRDAISYAFKELVSTFLNLEKAKIINSFGFKALLNNETLLNSIYHENHNYSEVLKKLDKNATFFLPFFGKRVQSLNVKNPTFINEKITKKLNPNKKINSFKQTNKVKIATKDIGTLNISLRPYTCLKRANIDTIQDLLNYSKDELLVLKNFGKKSLREVELSLSELGLQLKH